MIIVALFVIGASGSLYFVSEANASQNVIRMGNQLSAVSTTVAKEITTIGTGIEIALARYQAGASASPYPPVLHFTLWQVAYLLVLAFLFAYVGFILAEPELMQHIYLRLFGLRELDSLEERHGSELHA
jgi:hypothetical protein